MKKIALSMVFLKFSEIKQNLDEQEQKQQQNVYEVQVQDNSDGTTLAVDRPTDQAHHQVDIQ